MMRRVQFVFGLATGVSEAYLWQNKIMNLKFTFLLLFAVVSLNAQHLFKPGYYIDLSGTKHNVEIKDFDWMRPPADLQIRSSDGSITSLPTTQVLEFNVGNSKYRNLETDYFDYRINLKDVGEGSDLKFEKKTLLLRVLSEGRATLYGYNDSTEKFFFSTGTKQPVPLRYKKYFSDRRGHANPDTETANTVFTNRDYQNQLRNAVYCPSINYTTINYTRTDLQKLFDRYNNNCEKVKRAPQNRKKWSAGVYVVGMNSSVSVNNPYFYYYDNVKTDSKPLLKAGLDVEYFLPFANNSFSVIASPGYVTHKSTSTVRYETYPFTQHFEAKISALELPLGFRYYYYINPTNAAIFKLQYKFPYNLDSHFKTNTDTFKIRLKPGFHAGVGYQFRRLALEAEYHSGSMYIDGSSFSDRYITPFVVSVRYRMW